MKAADLIQKMRSEGCNFAANVLENHINMFDSNSIFVPDGNDDFYVSEKCNNGGTAMLADWLQNNTSWTNCRKGFRVYFK